MKSLVLAACLALTSFHSFGQTTPPPTTAPAAPTPPATAPTAPVTTEVAPTPTEAAEPAAPVEPSAPVETEVKAKPDTIGKKRMLKGVFAVFEVEQKNELIGTIKAQLFIDKVPKTVESFIGLVEGTKPFTEFDPARQKGATVVRPFYEGLTFHRVVPEYIIQGGCPLGTGKGGPGFTVPDEFRGDLRHDLPGTISMANTGRPNSAGSQFFITLKAPLRHLDNKFTVFGRVVNGLDVAKKIGMVRRNPITEKPVDPVIIRSVKIVREYLN